LQAASLQCHSQWQAAVKQYDAAMHSAANAADLASWAAVDTWQDEQRRQQTSAGSDSTTMPAQDAQRLCEVQLQTIQHPADTGQLVRLVLIALDVRSANESAAAGAFGGRDGTAAQLQVRLTSIEVEATKSMKSAAEELAVAINKSTTVQCRLLDEHDAAVSTS
jgi:hypothetical protein